MDKNEEFVTRRAIEVELLGLGLPIAERCRLA
jgi:hypothetical protein